MPIVRIDLRKGRDALSRRDIGRVICEAMVGGLAKLPGFRPEDVFTQPLELEKQTWSFRNDIARLLFC